jgi:cellulose biosynthesis protein BcsQ/tetratricopeptide (TPR) repeat protein
MATAPSERRGRIITFYSYKGGVGRSMSLANVATLLAGASQRVLVIDWDLEAPGLERFFESDQHGARGVALAQARTRKPGIVDLVKAFEAGQPLPWQDCVILTQPLEGRPPLSLISAGRDDSEYAPKVRSLDWAALFEDNDFGEYLEELRTQWLRAFDFILIDSRTGLTDSGGICTIHLPDIVVALFTANGQSVTGIQRVLREARHAHEQLPVDRSRLQLVPVPARDESQSEYENARTWRETFASELGEFYASWLPAGVSARQVLERLKIPYKPYWSFGERLPVVHEGTTDPASLGYAYAVLASLLETNLDWLAAPEAAAMRALPSQPAPGRSMARVGERALLLLPRALTWVLASLGFWFLVQMGWQRTRGPANEAPIAASAPSPERSSIEQRSSEAARLLRAGDRESARTLYDALITELDAAPAPGAASLGAARARLLPRAYLGRGEARVDGDVEGAVRDFARAAELAVDVSERAEALWRRADATEASSQGAAEASSQGAAALVDLAKVAELVPDEPLGLLARAEVEASRGHAGDAASHYRAFLRSAAGDAGPIDPGQLAGRAHYGLGEALRNSGQLAEAAEQYTLAIRDYESRDDRSPRFWKARYARGVVLRLLGRPEAALADFQAIGQQSASIELRDSALAVIRELGITRVKVFYARAADKNGALELATKINDIGSLNVAEVTLSSVPAVAEVRYPMQRQKDTASTLANQLNALLRKQYGMAVALEVRAAAPYAPAGGSLVAEPERTAIEIVLPPLTSSPSPAAIAPVQGKRSYLEIVQQDLEKAALGREWVAETDRSQAYSWVVVASRPTIEQAFDEHQRWKMNLAAKGAPGVELELRLKYAINYWYAIAFRANDADHQRAIVRWANEWEPAAYARPTFPIEIHPRPPAPLRKSAPAAPRRAAK